MKQKAIIIVAHPDDEALFFSSILDHRTLEKHVICITDGNADGRGAERDHEFKKCMEFFNVESFEKFNLPDRYDEGLDQSFLEEKLKQSFENYLEKDSLIFTHGPFGDYGHPHHITTSFVVHKILKSTENKIFTPNVLDHPMGMTFYEEKNIESTWEKKLEVLGSIYEKEYVRFVSLVPAKAKESYLQSNQETYKILDYLVNDTPLKGLKDYKPFQRSLELFKENGLKRKF